MFAYLLLQKLNEDFLFKIIVNLSNNIYLYIYAFMYLVSIAKLTITYMLYDVGIILYFK